MTAVPALAADWYVDVASGLDSYPGTPGAPFKSVTRGLTVASAGDTVHVAAGSYAETTSAEVFPLMMKSGVVLQGAGPDIVTLEGNGAQAVIEGTAVDANARVDGFTITGGSPGLDFSNSQATVSNNVIRGNTGEYGGGGVHSEGGAIRILGNLIADNWAWFGAGICSEQYDASRIEGNVIEANVGYYGVGIGCYYHASPTIAGNTIRGNTADTQGSGFGRASGAGMVAESASLPLVTETVIQDNHVEGADGTGGAVHLFSASAKLVNCLVEGNSSADWAITGINSGATEIVNSTIVDNDSGGIGKGSTSWPFTLVVRNSILRGNGAAEIDPTCAATVAYSDVEGGFSGTGNIDADPLFVGPADYHLTAPSPCVDAGGAEPAVLLDLDGEARPFGAGWDMGAYEYAHAAGDPVADAGGPYAGAEGDAVLLDGSGSYHPDAGSGAAIVRWDWDADGDGAYDDATGEHASCAYADDYHGTVGLRVTDADGRTDEATAAIDVANEAPELGEPAVPCRPVRVASSFEVSAALSDAGADDTHVATIDWGDGTESTGTVAAAGGAGTVSGSHAYAAPGLYSIVMRVADDDGGTCDIAAATSVVAYDPRAGWVTGAGVLDSPAGALLAEPDLEARVLFGFVSRYPRGNDVPRGSARFRIRAAGFHFVAHAQEWLVVDRAAATAQFECRGRVNGRLSPSGKPYRCTVWAGDGGGVGGADTLRIRVWYDSPDGSRVLVYDNGDGQTIRAGRIAVLGR